MSRSCDQKKAATARKPKEAAIIRAALAILRAEGDGGLSMRRVAAAAGMSLSNAQYYFPDRDALLRAMVEDYAAQCAVMIEEVARDAAAEARPQRLRRFLGVALADDAAIAEMCAIFREFWALSTRNEAIAGALAAYYRRYAEAVADALFDDVDDADARARAAFLLIAHVEGHSIMGAALAADLDATAAMLEDAIAALLARSPRRAATRGAVI